MRHELFFDHSSGSPCGWVLRVYRDGPHAMDDVCIGPDTEEVDWENLPDIDEARTLAADELGIDPEDVQLAD